LYAGGLHGNNSRSLQRLRNQSNLYRYFGTGFEEVHFIQLVIITPVGEKALTGRENRFETIGPNCLAEFSVTRKPVGSRSRTMLRDNALVIDISIHRRIHVPEKQV